MIFVPMGDDDAGQIVAALRDESRVSHIGVQAGRRIIGERHPHINGQPCAANAIDVQIHADFPGAAQGNEKQRFGGYAHSHVGLFKR